MCVSVCMLQSKDEYLCRDFDGCEMGESRENDIVRTEWKWRRGMVVQFSDYSKTVSWETEVEEALSFPVRLFQFWQFWVLSGAK